MAMAKAQTFADRGKPGAGYDTPRDVERNEEAQEAPKLSLFSYHAALEQVYAAMERWGYRMYPSPVGLWCGHEVYKAQKLAIPGLSQPENFQMFVPIRPSDVAARTSFFAHLKTFVEDAMCNAGSKSDAQIWQKLLLNFEDRLIDPKCEVATSARGYQVTTTPRVATLTGRSGYHKVVPPLAWFPRELQVYDTRKLLTLFPDAEAAALMLILGRLVAGANLTQVAEGQILHTMRSMALIIGQQAGLGKSTFLRHLTTTLTLMGYTQVEINSDFNKFGWAGVAQSDLATIDDLTDDTQKKMLGDPRIKTIVSNNTLKAEEKGVAATDVRATTVILGCSNNSNYSHYFGLDSGVLSRLNQLDTYTEHELQQRWGTDRSYNLKAFWDEEAARLSVAPETLMALLLRNCLDLFLEAAGMTFDARGYLQKDCQADILEFTINDLRSKYRIDVSLRHAEELTQVSARLVALTIAVKTKTGTQQPYIDALERLDFNPSLMLLAVRLFCEAQDQLDGPFDGLVCKHLSYDCLDYVMPKINDFMHMKAAKSIEKSFEAIVSELKSNKGFKYPLKSSHYQPMWMAERRLVPSLVQSYRAALEEIDLPSSLDGIASDCYKLFQRIVRR